MANAAAIPTWPRIEALTRPDGSGEVTINGTSQPIETSNAEDARHEIIQLVANTATKIGRPVRVATTGPDGSWPIIVHPDGSIEADTSTPGEPSHTPHPPTRQPTTPQAAARPSAPAAAAKTHPTAPHPAASHSAAPHPTAAAPQPRTPRRRAPATRQQEETPMTPVPEPSLGRSSGVMWPPNPAEPYRSRTDAASSPADAASTPTGVPTLGDLLKSRPAPPPGPPEWGWRSQVRRLTFGLVEPRPSQAELTHRADVASVQRSLSGPRTIVVVNPKGGAHKTTATMLIAATFGIHRGGYTLAWDNNETRGTLGWRAQPTAHTNTAVNLLADLERFDDATRSRVGDLDNYVRSQGSAQFDVLASDEDAAASADIDVRAFRRLHATLSRFYRVMVIDTGNNMRASNWGAAVEAADQLVIVSTIREDTAASAAWLIDGLRSRLFEDKIANAVTLLSSPVAGQPDQQLSNRLHTHFGQLTRAVINVPYDPALVDGAPIEIDRLRAPTREAWLHATAVISEGL